VSAVTAAVERAVRLEGGARLTTVPGTGQSQPEPGAAGSPVPPAASGAVATGPTPAQPALRPLDPPMVPFALGGMAVWLVALLVVIPFRDSHESWFWICVAGFLWGIPGLLTMIRFDARRRRRQ
jgi:hypothetical protein